MDGIGDFLREPALEKLEAMRKSPPLEIGEKLELETRKAMRKEKLVRIISELFFFFFFFFTSDINICRLYQGFRFHSQRKDGTNPTSVRHT